MRPPTAVARLRKLGPKDDASIGIDYHFVETIALSVLLLQYVTLCHMVSVCFL